VHRVHVSSRFAWLTLYPGRFRFAPPTRANGNRCLVFVKEIVMIIELGSVKAETKTPPGANVYDQFPQKRN
jgi:hypothetical protein